MDIELEKINLKVKYSTLHGMGLFSNSNFNSGQTITKISGENINAEECVKRELDGNVYIFWKDDDSYIDVSNSSSLRFINHSCDYNCDVDEDEHGNLILVASKSIKTGEELTIDYGYDEIYEYCSCNKCNNKPLKS
jgi:SET domain-containing protein